MSAEVVNLVTFFGRFHPLLLHLPIGGLVLLGFLELLARWTRFKDAAQNSVWILGFVSLTSLASAAAGLMLASSGGYDPHLLRWHRALGLALAAGCLLTWCLRRRQKFRAYGISLMATLLLLVITSHLGGSITHGSGFLTRYAPSPLRALLRLSRRGHPLPAEPVPPSQVFSSLIQPILNQQCVECHGPQKHKADLRLDDLANLLKGGQDGPVVQPGRAKESSLLQRMLLPSDADGHMPPEGKPQPTLQQIALLQWWIDSGAQTNETSCELQPQPEIVSKPAASPK